MSIISRMADASRDYEMAGLRRAKFVVSASGHKALADYQDDFWRSMVTGAVARPADIDFTQFVLGIPVEVDTMQAAEFIIKQGPEAPKPAKDGEGDAS